MTSTVNSVAMALGYILLYPVQRTPRSIQPRDVQTYVTGLYASTVRAVRAVRAVLAVLSGDAHR